MKSLLNFIYKYHYFILFILLECLSFIFIVQYNNYQHATFLNSSSRFSGNVYESLSSVTQYFNLRQTNQELLSELTKLRNQDKASYKPNQITLSEIYDSIYIQQFEYLDAQVINNSVNKQNNFITINRGSRHGVERGMAVVSVKGVVGVVKDISENYASIISVLNQNLKISAMVKKNNYFGPLHWEGNDFRYVTLNDLPNHISIFKGDTIITSGYSTIFPKGEFIGVVDNVSDSESGEFYNVKVLLAEDFKNLTNVLVVKNFLKGEQISLERRTSHD